MDSEYASFFPYGCKDFEVFWFSFILNHRVYVSALLYHPSDATNEVDLSIHISSVADYSFRLLSCSRFFLSRDFNYFGINLLSGFKQVFKAFTRGRTQLDRILTSFPSPFQDVQVSSLTVPTDHLAVIYSPTNRPENLQKLVIFSDQRDKNRQSFNHGLDNQD